MEPNQVFIDDNNNSKPLNREDNLYQPDPQNAIALQKYNQNAHKDHKAKIMEIQGLFVKQKLNLAEVISGCDFENTYNIYKKIPGKEEKKGQKIWKAKEKSNYCSRNFVAQTCRAFKLKVKNINRVDEDAEDQVCLTLKRPCTCSFCCFNRPFISITYTENGQNMYLGKIQDPYDFCNRNFLIFDKDDQEIYKIEAGCCQLGIICQGFPCQSCEFVKFGLTDLRTGEEEAPLVKKNKDCLKSMISEADNFALEFPQKADWEERSLLMGAILFIDYMMFEEKHKKKNENHLQEENTIFNN